MELKPFDIDRVEVFGDIDFRKVLPESYEQIRENFRGEGIDLPSPSFFVKDIDKIGNFWILLSPLRINIYYANYGTCSYLLNRGHMTDLASVPKRLRSFVDDNGADMIIASLIHDINFGGHILPFKESNLILRYMMLYTMKYCTCKSDKFSVWFNAWCAWLGVSSFIGKMIYNRSTKFSSDIYLQHVIIHWALNPYQALSFKHL